VEKKGAACSNSDLKENRLLQQRGEGRLMSAAPIRRRRSVYCTNKGRGYLSAAPIRKKIIC